MYCRDYEERVKLPIGVELHHAQRARVGRRICCAEKAVTTLENK